ncbi:hypothetical protein Adt_00882 [Abeliophyllum distichum]|uniref:Flocculation protein n=1 Tax=Abeliophyllum distichum TaxID=126358 RepID=A0ABD1VRA9_9LAMI
MVNSEKQESRNNRQIEDVNRVDQDTNGEDSIDDSSDATEISSVENPSLTQRLKEILVEDGDGDLLLQQSGRGDGFLRWLQALDMQVMGACRTDERLKPLLKLKFSAGAAEDCLLAHLSQHFEPSEVGMLARCLCMPLVSIRVGKITKQGSLLCPTAIRGNLNLTVLPNLDLRISFTGDDGHMERVATLSTNAQCSAVEIGEISADESGRSFSIKIPDSETFYFWCSEKSKLLGNELLRKMKDLLTRKPSLAELTGINASRFNCFASHIRAHLAGSLMASAKASSFLPATPSLDNSVDSFEASYAESSLESPTTSRFGVYGSQGTKTNPVYQASLGFTSGSVKDLTSLSGVSREKLSRHEEICMSCVDSLAFASPSCVEPNSSNCFEKDELSDATGTKLFPQFSFLDALGNSIELPFLGPETQIPSQLPISLGESVSLPPLSSLLATARQSSLLPSKLPLNLDKVPPIDFPPLLPEQLLRLPLPLPLPLPIPTSQQIMTFSPLTCEPIVHVPVIEVCSSGQGYLVSAGPTISTTIPSLGSDLVSPLIPDVESVVERGARETLRLLISSSNQPSPQLLDVFPSVLTNSSHRPNILSVSNSIAAMGMVSEISLKSSIGKRCISRDESVDRSEKPAGFGPSFFEDYCSDLRDEQTD